MSYKKSRSRQSFEREIASIFTAIKESQSKKCDSQLARNYVLCCAILLSCAKVEEYIQEIVNDWATTVSNCGKSTDILPDNIRAYILANPEMLHAYKHYIAFNDEKVLIRKLSATINKPYHNMAISKALPIPTIEGKYLYANRKYPSPDNMKILFYRLGINKIFQELDKSAKKDMEGILTSFNDTRTSMAHAGIPVGLNSRDIKEKINAIKMFISHLDRVIYKHVCKITGQSSWK